MIQITKTLFLTDKYILSHHHFNAQIHRFILSLFASSTDWYLISLRFCSWNLCRLFHPCGLYQVIQWIELLGWSTSRSFGILIWINSRNSCLLRGFFGACRIAARALGESRWLRRCRWRLAPERLCLPFGLLIGCSKNSKNYPKRRPKSKALKLWARGWRAKDRVLWSWRSNRRVGTCRSNSWWRRLRLWLPHWEGWCRRRIGKSRQGSGSNCTSLQSQIRVIIELYYNWPALPFKAFSPR